MISLTALIPNAFFQSLANETSERTEAIKEDNDELVSRVTSDIRFTVIEPELKPHSGRTVIETTNQAEEFKHKSDSKFLHQLFPLLPGYNAYINAMEKSDAYSIESQNQASRVFNHSEFKLTCDMVNDLEEGLDIHASDHDGSYFGGAGETPENFEALLQGCGDTELRYLDELKIEAEHLADSLEEQGK